MERQPSVVPIRPNESTVLTQSGNLTIRLMRDEPHDFSLMAHWLSDERVLEYYEGRDRRYNYEAAVAKWGPRTRGEHKAKPCLILLDGREIGYIQYYPVEKEFDLPDRRGTYGIDMFIGECELWGRGLGSRALALTAGYIFRKLHGRRLVIDPRVSNHRAVRAYEKAGFRKMNVLKAHELHEGEARDCWLMMIERNRHNGSGA